MTVGVACGSCGTGLRENAKFCDECGAPTAVSGDTAEAVTDYVVYVRIGDSPWEISQIGRYHDRFQRVDGEWRYVFRDYSLMDMVGDVSQPLHGPIARATG